VQRDWLLIPLLAAVTVVVLAASIETVARKYFSERITLVNQCLTVDDPTMGTHAIPNSVCWEKSAESPLIEYRFNSCGHRAGVECGPKPSGSYRIVMIGSSVAMGDRVRQPATLAALLPSELSRIASRPVDLYNEGMRVDYSHFAARHFEEALHAQPDLIIWVLTPYDIQTEILSRNPAANENLAAKAWFRIKLTFSAMSFSDGVDDLKRRALEPLLGTATAQMVQHWLYKSQSQYLRGCLFGGDSFGYLRSNPSPQWRSRMHMFDQEAAAMEARAKSAGIPIVAVLIPGRPQAAMISNGAWPEGFDPYELDKEVKSAIVGHGGIYLDIFPSFATIRSAELNYFPVDGHPTEDGHKLLTRLIAQQLTNGSIAQLKAAPQKLTASEQGR
jgi:hypothetical protein